MTLAHQEPVSRSQNGEIGKVKDFKFSLQWIHNKDLYKLKSYIFKAQALEDTKKKFFTKYEKAKEDLDDIQNEDVVTVVRKLLHKDRYQKEKKVQESISSIKEGSITNDHEKQYLSFSESEEEVKDHTIKGNNSSSTLSLSKYFAYLIHLDLTTDNLRQLALKNRRQAVKISLFGGLMDEFMK